MRWSVLLCLVVSSQVVLAEPWDVPPPPRGQWVVDQTGKVPAATQAGVNRIAAALDASGAGQLGVLVAATTSGVKPRDFATGVFNSWGVGHGGAGDGVLLFIAVGDRKAEIILGEGSKIATAATDAVMREQVVANLKRGSLDGALLEASEALAGLARRAAGGPSGPSHADNTGIGPDAYTTRPVASVADVDPALVGYVSGGKAFPERSPRTWVVDLSERLTPPQRAQLDVAASDVYASDKGRIFFLVGGSAHSYPALDQLKQRFLRQVTPLSRLPLAVITLDLVRRRGSIQLPQDRVTSPWELEQLRAAEATLEAQAAGDPVTALLGAQRFAQQALETGIPPRPMGEVLHEGLERNRGKLNLAGGGLFIGAMMMLRRWNRRRPRACEKCQQPRELLDEAADDAHLSGSQKTEERVGSVDYDVWRCGRCSDALVLRYGAWFTAYSRCPECSSHAKTSSSTTVSRATEYSTGTERIDERCEHCSFRNSFTRTTPRIQRASSSSSSSSGSSWSSSSSSSFGGGGSSGSGSSGSW